MAATGTRTRRTVSAEARGRLSRDQVVEAALKLVDRDGLDTLSLRRIAAELGVTPMALYWHVADKDALLDALGERMFAGVEIPERVEDWAADLRNVCVAVIVRMREHPAVAPLAVTTVLTSQGGLVLAERVLSVLCEAGFGDQEAADVGAFLLSAMVTLVTALPGAEPTADPQAEHERMGEAIAGLTALPVEQFPSVTRMAGKLIDCNDPDSYLRRGLDVLMLGIQGLVGQAPARRASTRRTPTPVRG